MTLLSCDLIMHTSQCCLAAVCLLRHTMLGTASKCSELVHAGVVLYVMLAGCLPFEEDSMALLVERISSATYDVPPWITAPAAAVVSKLLDPNPSTR